jgi:hypothetical protein
MPQPLAPTLVEIRNSVLVRAGYTIVGDQAADMYPLADEMIRKAQNELHREAPWLTQRSRAEYALTTGESVYDTPDDAQMSRIGRVAVINQAGNEYDLIARSGAQVRNATKTSAQPRYYEITENALLLHPSPNDDWVTLVIEYYAGPAALLGETDRPNVDGEALIQRAAYLVKRATGLGGDWNADMQDHMRYLALTAREQGEIGSISMIGRVPIAPASFRRRNIAWRDDWSPW